MGSENSVGRGVFQNPDLPSIRICCDVNAQIRIEKVAPDPRATYDQEKSREVISPPAAFTLITAQAAKNCKSRLGQIPGIGQRSEIPDG